MLFTPSTYAKLKKSLSQKHQRYLKTLLLKLKKTDPAFSQVLSHYSLTPFSSLHFYLAQQLQSLITYQQATDKLSTHADEFSEFDDLIFEQWNASEFSGDFLKALNKGLPIKEAHLQAIANFKDHLQVLFDRFLHSSNTQSSHYRIQTSLGETGSKAPKKLLHSVVNIEGKFLDIYAHSLKEFKSHASRIELALKLIKFYSPTSWERFTAFTEVIIPIKDEELVSYSHQELPGFSMINLYHRDFIDLLDDLLHENGHHHLNYYLNLHPLIQEPQQLDYFSPWRDSPRPLRGIYHAFFTFFWAYQLFADMIKNREQLQSHYQFTKAEWKKIYSRAVEEHWMLLYSYEDIKKAKKKGLISVEGWELVQTQYKLIIKDKKLMKTWEQEVVKRELTSLKKALSNARQEF